MRFLIVLLVSVACGYCYRIKLVQSGSIQGIQKGYGSDTSPGKLPYNTAWAYQLDASTDFMQWFDGVLTTSTSNKSTANKLKNLVNPTATYLTFPAQLQVTLDKIRFYDGPGQASSPLHISLLLSNGKEITDVALFTGAQYNEWVTIYAVPEGQKSVRAVILRTSPGNASNSGAQYPTEIEFYGTHVPHAAPVLPVSQVPLRNMYGINSFPWNNSGKLPDATTEIDAAVGRYADMGWNRAYDDWKLFEAVEGDYRFAPTHTGGWNQDRGFARIKALGVKSIQCLKTIPDWLRQRYPMAVKSGNQVDGSRWDQSDDAAYQCYRGNLIEYPSLEQFPADGATPKLLVRLASGAQIAPFPYTIDQPTYFTAKDTQLVYRWNGSGYVLLRENIPGVYFSIYTQQNATANNPVGKLLTKWNEQLNADRLLPESYKAFAHMAFQSAARYGANKQLDIRLLKTPDKLVGLNLLEGIEAGNEMNAFWQGRRRYLNPWEYAACLSAFYDGHLNKMGPGVGVKNADSSMKVFVGGIVSANPRFYRAMLDWCKVHRGYKANGKLNVPWDVMKYHQYTNSNGLEQHSNGSRIGMPADMVPLALAKVQEIKNLYAEYNAGVPSVHIGELGYDVGPSTQAGAEINDARGQVVRTRRQTVGDWVIRDMLAYNYAGADALQFYLLEDPSHNATPDANGSLYMSSGFFNRGDQVPSKAPRPAAVYARQFVKQFGAYTVVGCKTGSQLLYTLTSGTSKAYALAVPDMIGRSSVVDLTLPKGGTLYTFRDEGDKMAVKALASGKCSIIVRETPCFVKVN